MEWWAHAGVVTATIIGMGTIAVGAWKFVEWLWGRTLGQRIDGYAAEVRADRAERREWEQRHEAVWHGYPPATWQPTNGYRPPPIPTLGNAVRSHRR